MTASPAGGAGAPRPLAGCTVLIVEDNAPLRAVMRRYLQDAGCTIVEAGAPSEALSVAQAHPDRIDIALVDLILPEMSGPECADLLREAHPDLAVAYMSGYAESVSEGFPEDDTPVLLTKPFAREELVRTIREVLGLDSGPTR